MMLFKKVLILFLVYLTIYRPEMFFIPHSINLTFGMMGLLLYLFRSKYNKYLAQKTTQTFRWMIVATAPIVIISIGSCLTNFSTDFEFVTYPLTLTFALFFSYLVATLFYDVYGKIEARTILGYIFSCQLIYIILAVLMFVSPAVKSLLLPLLKLGETAESIYSMEDGIRLTCFGASFYTAGLINGFVLILLAFYISVYKHSQIKLVLLYLFYILITATGMMMARTTLVGAGIGICVLVYYWLKSGKEIFKTIFYVSLAIYLLIALISRLSVEAQEIIERLSDFAFELFINFQETGSASTASSDRLIEMYETMPDNFITWLVGDARWVGENGSYYKHVDVGYLRSLFYFGMLGVFALFYFYASALRRVILKNNMLPQGNMLLFLSLLGYVLVLNLKGPADLFYYIIPFLYCDNHEYAG